MSKTIEKMATDYSSDKTLLPAAIREVVVWAKNDFLAGASAQAELDRAEIEWLKSQLAACAAGPWQDGAPPTDIENGRTWLVHNPAGFFTTRSGGCLGRILRHAEIRTKGAE